MTYDSICFHPHYLLPSVICFCPSQTTSSHIIGSSLPDQPATTCVIPVKNGFPTRLNGKMIGVEQKIMGKETVKVKLSSRAVVKEQGLGDVCLHKRRCTQIET